MKRSCLLFGGLLLALSPPAQAQEPPPSSGAVPRPDGKPAAPAAPAAPPAGFTKPRLRKDSQPTYPPAAEKAGVEAQVTVTIDVDVQGHVTRAVVPKPVGYGFDEAAIEAAKG